MNQRRAAQRRRPTPASLAKNGECPSPIRSAWRETNTCVHSAWEFLRDRLSAAHHQARVGQGDMPLISAVPLIATESPRRRGPGCISAWRNVTAPAIEDFHDARKQGGSN